MFDNSLGGDYGDMEGCGKEWGEGGGRIKSQQKQSFHWTEEIKDLVFVAANQTGVWETNPEERRTTEKWGSTCDAVSLQDI